MNETAAPKKITLDRPNRRLVVVWADGREDRLPWSLLRARCPSAGEQAARETSDPLGVLKVVPSDELVSARLVGAYAVNFTWGDGHNTGIYSWEYLRQLAIFAAHP